MNWIIPSNEKKFDSIKAFRDMKILDWIQKYNFVVGDIIYIYCSKPIQRITLKVEVQEINISPENIIDDSKYWPQGISKKNQAEKYMRLKLVEFKETEELSKISLMENGLKSNIQGAMKLKGELLKYIESIFNEVITIDSNLECEQEVISIPAGSTIDLIYNNQVHAHPIKDSGYSYKRAMYYTFREPKGIIKKLYVVEKIFNMNINNVQNLYDINLSNAEIARVEKYVEERKRRFGFNEAEVYKFYILREVMNLENEVVKPGLSGHIYLTLNNILGGKNSEDENKISNRKGRREVNIDFEELDDIELLEGDKITKVINTRKRNKMIRSLKLDQFRAINGSVHCEICNENEEVVLDIHHNRVRVAEMEDNHKTRLSDLMVVCANCHRKIHHSKIILKDI